MGTTLWYPTRPAGCHSYSFQNNPDITVCRLPDKAADTTECGYACGCRLDYTQFNRGLGTVLPGYTNRFYYDGKLFLEDANQTMTLPSGHSRSIVHEWYGPNNNRWVSRPQSRVKGCDPLHLHVLANDLVVSAAACF